MCANKNTNVVTASNKTPVLLQTMEEMEISHITKVLEHTKWVIEGENGAAKTLKLNPNTLWSRMQKLGIRRPN